MKRSSGSFIIQGFFLSIVSLFSFSAFGQAGLTLGGKFVPRDSIYLYLFLGNSVMSGRDTPADTITDSHAWKYVMTTNCYTYKKTCPPQYSWQPGVDPTCFDSKNPLDGVVKCSPGIPFVKRMAKDYPGYYFGVAQLSGSAWQLTHYQPPNSGDLKAFVTQGNALKQNCHIAGVVMLFNIVEIQYCNGSPTYVNIVNYCAHIDSVITYLRTNLGIPDLPLIQSDYPVMGGDPKKPTTDNYSIAGPWTAAIKALMDQNKLAAKTIANTVLLPTDSLPMYGADGLFTHYNTLGNNRWANRVADSICSRKWGPNSKCGTAGIGASVKHSGMTPYSSTTRKVLFDGSNRSVFDKAGKSFSIYLPNGKIVPCAGVRNKKLLPGVYLIHINTEK
jgi:hypothetical protein